MSRDNYINLIASLKRMTLQLEACIALEIYDSIQLYCKIAGSRLEALDEHINVLDMDKDIALEYKIAVHEYKQAKEYGHQMLRSRIKRIA